MSLVGYLGQVLANIPTVAGGGILSLGVVWGASTILTIFGTAYPPRRTYPRQLFELDTDAWEGEWRGARRQSIADVVTALFPVAVLTIVAVEPTSIKTLSNSPVAKFLVPIALTYVGFLVGVLSAGVLFMTYARAERLETRLSRRVPVLSLERLVKLGAVSSGIGLLWVVVGPDLIASFPFPLSGSAVLSVYFVGSFVGAISTHVIFLIGLINVMNRTGTTNDLGSVCKYSILLHVVVPPLALLVPLDLAVHGPLFLLGGTVSLVVGRLVWPRWRRRRKRSVHETEARRAKECLEQLEATGDADGEVLRELRTTVTERLEPALGAGDYATAYEWAKKIHTGLEGRDDFVAAARVRNAIDAAETPDRGGSIGMPNPIGELDDALQEARASLSRDSYWSFSRNAEEASNIAMNVGPDYSSWAIHRALTAITEVGSQKTSATVPDDSKEISELRFDWVDDVDDESTRADLQNAAEKLTEAVAARDDEDYSKAIALADDAYLITEPTLEYLLDEAKREASDAETAFESDDFDAAIEHWHSAEDRYDRALELATARDETEMATSVEDALGNVCSNVENARTKRANAKMVELADVANEATARGNELFEAGDYEDAMESYRTGAERYADAADVAAEHGFDDEPRLRTASERARTSVEDCKLARGERMVEAGAELVDDDPDEAVDALDDAIAYLDGLDFERDELDTLQTEARRWHVEASTAVGRELMEEAEDLYDDEERHAAKERFEDAKDHFREVMDDAIEHGFTDERSSVSDLVDACIENARLISEELTEVGAVEPDLEHVDDVTDATTDYSPTDRLRQPGRSGPGVEDLVRAELPDHEVLEPIGGGGNADVHKVRLAETGAVRALKRPRWHDTLSEEVTADFVAEAETWTNVDDHDGVVTVHDWGTVPEPWILMEFVEGGNLRKLVGQVDPGRAVDLLTDCCNALGHAHRRGIAHMDVKPGNLLLTDDGAVKVGDWGLARIVVQHTSGREGLTTPYAAPEQIEPAEYDSPDTYTDIYQLGVVAYELLTGRVPFDRDTQSATMQAILKREPTPPSEVDSDVPAAFDEPLLEALAKHREDRHESILLFRNSLQAALQAV